MCAELLAMSLRCFEDTGEPASVATFTTRLAADLRGVAQARRRVVVERTRKCWSPVSRDVSTPALMGCVQEMDRRARSAATRPSVALAAEVVTV